MCDLEPEELAELLAWRAAALARLPSKVRTSELRLASRVAPPGELAAA